MRACAYVGQRRFTLEQASLLALHLPTANGQNRVMIRLPARPVPSARKRGPAVALAAGVALACGAPPTSRLAAQQTFSLPPSSPSPTPAPAGPADERAGVAIPPRPVPTARPTATPAPAPAPAPTVAPSSAPAPAPGAALPAAPRPTPTAAPNTTPNAGQPRPALTPQATPGTVPEASATLAPAPQDTAPPPGTAGAPLTLPPNAAPQAEETTTDTIIALPEWPMIAAAGGLGVAVLLGGAALLRRRRKPKVPRLAAHPAAAAPESVTAPDLSDLVLKLDVTSATRSVMMFTLGYRLTIANRSGKAVNDLTSAAQLVCARASAAVAGSNGPSVGSAQALGGIERIGPHQARSISGEVQLPLSAIQPLRQGSTPLFVPLVHVTLEAEGQRAVTRTFVIGTPSASGRVHPIPMDQGPGGITGLVAQGIAVPPASAAA